MVKIVFLRPKINIPEPMPYPHMGIGYLASILRKNGHEVYFFDCAILKEPYSEIVKEVENLNPDVLGITAVSAYYSEMKKLAWMLGKLEIPIIIGGVHVTILPELSLREVGAEFAILGEGEITILELMNNWEDHEKRKEVKGIAYIEEDQLIVTGQRDLIEDLDGLPFPAWDVINPLNYSIKDSYFKVKRYPVGLIFTSRGCPHICSFCASCNFWRHKFRCRSPKNVVDEIEYQVREFGIREMQFGDDYFNHTKKHVIEICREIQKRKLDLTFSCPNGLRIENVDEELLTIMKKTGFYSLTFAFESGSQKVLDGINKKLRLKRAVKILKLAKKLGYFINGYFMFGLPGETYETARRTMQLAKKLPFDALAFFLAKPLPGSIWFDDWVQNKDISKIDYDWFHFLEIENKLEFSDGNHKFRVPAGAWREFYFRPIQLWRYFKYLAHTFPANRSIFVQFQRFLRQIFNILRR